MNYGVKVLILFAFLSSTLLLSGCLIVRQEQKNESQLPLAAEFQLTQFKDSDFKQVEATFFTHQSKELVFRVLSDIEQTSQWLDRVENLEVIAAYNNQQYLLRTIIDSPWPFKKRELITCVNTSFEENITTINIASCSERVPVNDLYLRLLEVQSSWRIKKISNTLVEVNYKTWINPAGNVPAFIFNSELIDSTKIDINRLQNIIDNSSLSDYAY
jgi:hypothetical protein